MTEIKKDEVYVEESLVATTEQTVALNPFDVLSQAVATAENPIADMFDRYQKLIFVMDESGSMSASVAPDIPERDLFDWTPEVLSAFRSSLKAEFFDDARENHFDDNDEISASDELDAENEAEDRYDDLNLDDDTALIDYLIEFGRHHNLPRGIVLEKNHDLLAQVETPSKIEMVRHTMKDFVEARFKRFPEAQIMVMGFDEVTRIHCQAGASKEEVFDAITKLNAHGHSTKIYPAVRAAVKECKRRPSRVGAHHILLVSDGQDSDAVRVSELIPEMHKLNIVFDFIFVKGENQYVSESVTKVLKGVCSDTRGEYFEVNTQTDFTQKFLQVANRLALPPARE